MSRVSELYLNALTLKSGVPLTLDDLCAVLYNALADGQRLFRALRWNGLEESERVEFAKAAALALGCTRCGCRRCRTSTVLAPMLMISAESARELLDKAYPERGQGPRAVK